MRGRLEAEQNKCARTITGCATRKDALLTEADLPALSLRALQLAGSEYIRLLRTTRESPFFMKCDRAYNIEPTGPGEDHAATPPPLEDTNQTSGREHCAPSPALPEKSRQVTC